MTKGAWDKLCNVCSHTETEHGPGIYDKCKGAACGCGRFHPCDCERCRNAPGYPPLCEDCDEGEVMLISSLLPDLEYRFEECPRCLGTGIQPIKKK